MSARTRARTLLRSIKTDSVQIAEQSRGKLDCGKLEKLSDRTKYSA